MLKDLIEKHGSTCEFQCLRSYRKLWRQRREGTAWSSRLPSSLAGTRREFYSGYGRPQLAAWRRVFKPAAVPFAAFSVIITAHPQCAHE